MIALLLTLVLAQDSMDARIAALGPRLASESIEERAAAIEDLKQLVRSDPAVARKALRARLGAESDADVKAALGAAIDALPPLELTLSVKGEPREGEAVRVEARIRNLTDHDILLVPSIHGADLGMRYPKYEVSAARPKGTGPAGRKLISEIIKSKAITEGDFRTVKPGEEFDPYEGDGVRLPRRQEWTPEVAGRWTFRLVADFTGPDSQWVYGMRTEAAPDEARAALVARVPHVKLEASLEVDVKPAAPAK